LLFKWLNREPTTAAAASAAAATKLGRYGCGHCDKARDEPFDESCGVAWQAEHNAQLSTAHAAMIPQPLPIPFSV
jgi:hypothetical protein